ncbi:MAG: EamA family transporter [Alphaproteobacteria bacterium]|nr:EamA family transporter [Alphaproteobacteria bacterium]
MPFLLLCVVWITWGVSYPLTAIALAGLDVFTLRTSVQIVGAAALLAQALVSGASLRMPRETWPDLVIAGLLNMAIFPICMNFGVYLMSPGRASVLVYTMPIWATLFAWPLLGERVTATRAAALALGAAAVVVLVSQNLSQLRNAPLGAALTIGAAISFGLGTVWLKRRVWHAHASVIAFWQLVIGLVPLVVVWATLSAPPDLSRAGLPQILSLLFLGLAANGVAYFAWFRLVPMLPASITGISSLAVPCIGVASSTWLAHERLSGRDLTSTALIGAALACVLSERLWMRRRRAPQPVPNPAGLRRG